MKQKRVKICGIPVDVLAGEAEGVKAIAAALKQLKPKQKLQVAFINAHVVNTAVENREYLSLLNETSFNLADGIGVWIAGKMRRKVSLINLNGTDFGVTFLRWCAKNKKKVFFLGAKPGIAEKARINLEKTVRGLDVAGVHHGYRADTTIDEVIRLINKSGAEVLYTCLGVPAQEFWIRRHLASLTKIRIAFGLGAFFDFHSGTIKRAPLWIRKIRMEWFFRLCKEPRRLWRRYIIGNVKFLYRSMVSSR